MPTFFVEFLPRIEAVQVTLAGRSTSNFSFTKNAINYYHSDNEQGGKTTVQVCSWDSPQLNLQSCREMKLIPGGGINMRFTIATDIMQEGGQYQSCPGYVVPRDELAEYGAERCQLSLKCGFCHMELSVKEQ